MATVTGLTAERMLEIEGQSVVSGEIVNGHLILTKFDGTTVDAGVIPPGPPGPMGPSGGQIPGELKIWPGGVLPAIAEWGRWVWADGAVYAVATYPKAAAHIHSSWRTFGGASDPGAANFRVPDMRGLTPVGLDAMPGGARANRMTRSVAITLAGRTGEETHVVTVAEMPAHAHGVYDPGHAHLEWQPAHSEIPMSGNLGGTDSNRVQGWTDTRATGISLYNAGGGGGHENIQPSVFVPYIVKMDD